MLSTVTSWSAYCRREESTDRTTHTGWFWFTGEGDLFHPRLRVYAGGLIVTAKRQLP